MDGAGGATEVTCARTAIGTAALQRRLFPAAAGGRAAALEGKRGARVHFDATVTIIQHNKQPPSSYSGTCGDEGGQRDAGGAAAAEAAQKRAAAERAAERAARNSFKEQRRIARHFVQRSKSASQQLSPPARAAPDPAPSAPVCPPLRTLPLRFDARACSKVRPPTPRRAPKRKTGQSAVCVLL